MERVNHLIESRSGIGMLGFPDQEFRLCCLYRSGSQTVQLIGKTGAHLLNPNCLFYLFIYLFLILNPGMLWIIDQMQRWDVSNCFNGFVKICLPVISIMYHKCSLSFLMKISALWSRNALHSGCSLTALKPPCTKDAKRCFPCQMQQYCCYISELWQWGICDGKNFAPP